MDQGNHLIYRQHLRGGSSKVLDFKSVHCSHDKEKWPQTTDIFTTIRKSLNMCIDQGAQPKYLWCNETIPFVMKWPAISYYPNSLFGAAILLLHRHLWKFEICNSCSNILPWKWKGCGNCLCANICWIKPHWYLSIYCMIYIHDTYLQNKTY